MFFFSSLIFKKFGLNTQCYERFLKTHSVEHYLIFSGHAIHLNSAPGLNAATTSSYTLTITCADNYGASQGTLTVNIVANAAPDITNLPASKTVQEGATGGSSILTVAVTDPESDTFSCSMSSAPVSTAFSLDYTTRTWLKSLGYGFDHI